MMKIAIVIPIVISIASFVTFRWSNCVMCKVQYFQHDYFQHDYFQHKE